MTACGIVDQAEGTASVRTQGARVVCSGNAKEAKVAEADSVKETVQRGGSQK